MIRPCLVALLFGCCGLAAGEAGPVIWTEPGTAMAFVRIQAGCYTMGTDPAIEFRPDDQLRQLGYKTSRFADERPVHRVCLNAFWLGRNEVTAEEWQRVMGAPPPAGTGQQPASGMTWLDARRFADQLSRQGNGRFRLPTEAEWEFACRELDHARLAVLQPEDRMAQAWYSLRERRVKQPAEVGQLGPNAAGLHDLLGNVWEWTQDAYVADRYALDRRDSGADKAVVGSRSIRGGSFRSEFLELRCANRAHYPVDQGLEQIGLRLLREEP